MYKCDNVGCRYSNKYREQIRRDKKKCTLPSASKKHLHLDDGKYQCQACNKTFSQQSNASRHHKNDECNKLKIVPIHTCDICQKTFAYKSVLERHEKTHQTKKQKTKKESKPKTKDGDIDFTPSFLTESILFESEVNNANICEDTPLKADIVNTNCSSTPSSFTKLVKKGSDEICTPSKSICASNPSSSNRTFNSSPTTLLEDSSDKISYVASPSLSLVSEL